MTQHHRNRTGRMTHIPGNMETFAYQSQYSIVTQHYVDLCGFIGPMTQHQRHCNRTARMTHMPGGVGTFTYQSQYR